MPLLWAGAPPFAVGRSFGAASGATGAASSMTASSVVVIDLLASGASGDGAAGSVVDTLGVASVVLAGDFDFWEIPYSFIAVSWLPLALRRKFAASW